MKVLLDENLPHRLRNRLSGHEVFTVSYMGWAGLKNGELLNAAEQLGFEAFVTGDQTLSYEQNFTGRRLAVLVLSTIDRDILTSRRAAQLRLMAEQKRQRDQARRFRVHRK